MNFSLEGKVAIVTGAARGIGKAIARHLLKQGMSVTIADVNQDTLNQTVETLSTLGPVAGVKTDVTNEDEIKQMVAVTIERFGRLDALINNAGLANPNWGKLPELELEKWERVIRTNLTGPMLCAKHAITALKESHGSIVNISSTRALQSEPHNEAYAASKGGLISLTQALAISHGPEVRSNCICPGWIVTADQISRKTGKIWEPSQEIKAIHPVGRLGSSEDIAHMVAFLISDKSGFITGQHFVVDGGMTKKMMYS